jgi:hypothetical protein
LSFSLLSRDIALLDPATVCSRGSSTNKSLIQGIHQQRFSDFVSSKTRILVENNQFPVSTAEREKASHDGGDDVNGRCCAGNSPRRITISNARQMFRLFDGRFPKLKDRSNNPPHVSETVYSSS